MFGPTACGRRQSSAGVGPAYRRSAGRHMRRHGRVCLRLPKVRTGEATQARHGRSRRSAPSTLTQSAFFSSWGPGARVIVPLDLDMVIEPDAALEPVGILERNGVRVARSSRKRSSRSSTGSGIERRAKSTCVGRGGGTTRRCSSRRFGATFLTAPNAEPEPVLGGLQSRATTAKRRLEARANRRVFGPIGQRVVRRLIRSYRKAMPFREFPKQGMAHVFATVHEICAEAGETLAENGHIECPDDVWFLRRDELLAIFDGVPLEVDIKSRRRTHDRYANLTAPPLLTSEGEHPTATRQWSTDGEMLVGTAVSRAWSKGRPASSATRPKGVLNPVKFSSHRPPTPVGRRSF